MRLSVDHRTVYTFTTPVRGLTQSHRLTPASFDGQKVLSWDVAIDNARFGAGFRDGAGDWLQTMTLLGELGEVEIRISGVVETGDTSGVLKGHKEKVPPLSYLTSTRFTRPDRTIEDLAASAVRGIDGSDRLAQAHALSLAISEAVAYSPGVTSETTTAAEALAEGKGVCQDQTHALIAAALTVDMPARYVTGYLFATEDTEGAEASHAWAELYVSGLGWVGFDPTNQCCPDEKYIRLGSGADAEDAAPIRGVTIGVSEETLDVSVAVQQAAQ